MTPPKLARLALTACVLIAALPLAAQYPAAQYPATPAPSNVVLGQPAPSPFPALFLSDIHLDPFHDPAKVARLNSAPEALWSSILSSPDSPTQAAEYAALQQTCPVRGVDTTNLLWQSSLYAIHARAGTVNPVHFVTLSGDLLAHSFDCKYRTLLPTATSDDYLDFTEKTVRYIVQGLRRALPGVPIYIALGNNDSGCGDYHLYPAHDAFLARIAPIVAQAIGPALPAEDLTSLLTDFDTGGYYNVPLAGVPHTRLIVLDNIYLSSHYTTCSGAPDPAPGEAQLAWLAAQLAVARAAHDSVWVMAHIPPGVDVYATLRKSPNLCASSAPPTMFLSSEKLAKVLDANADVVRLALFGHTHNDEIGLLTPEASLASPSPSGVPLKVVASISPVNGNNPTFTLATVSPVTASLLDYTVVMASNLTGSAATWASEYTYSTAYREAAFSPSDLDRLVLSFQADPSAQSPASMAYLRAYFPGDLSPILKLAWPEYACSMDHDSPQSFRACACPTAK